MPSDFSGCRFEPTIDEALSDPIVRALIAADGVNPAALRDMLHLMVTSADFRRSAGIVACESPP